jgi:hypothetical protein
MSTFTIDEHAPILVEFKPAAGVVRTALSPADLAEQSRKALDAAMNTIHAMAERVNATIAAISDRPNKVEVEFGLKLDAQAGALVASASTEAGFNVKLTWERKEPPSALPEID